MILKIDPKWIPGRWRYGVSLDAHTLRSDFIGHDEFGHAQFDTERSEIGERLYRLKYSNDSSCIDDIADTSAAYLRQLSDPPFCVAPTLLIPVPPSRQRANQPLFLLASAIAQRLQIPVTLSAVTRTKALPELKGVNEYASRLDLLRDAHSVDRTQTAGASVLLLDDLFRSGATVNAVASGLLDMGGVRDIFVLTITRTRSNK
jgi:predicted amidophosphoribosyltransferase